MMSSIAIWTAHCPTYDDLIEYLNDPGFEIRSIEQVDLGFVVEYVDLEYEDARDFYEPDDCSADAEALASAGMGTDEDYGCYEEL